jgi:hypothetical protein
MAVAPTLAALAWPVPGSRVHPKVVRLPPAGTYDLQIGLQSVAEAVTLFLRPVAVKPATCVRAWCTKKAITLDKNSLDDHLILVPAH